VDVYLATADTGELTRVVESSGGQVSFHDVHANFMDIMLDAGSNLTLTAVGANRRLVIARHSGSQDFAVIPSCPVATATLSGTGAAVELRITVVASGGCTDAGPSAPSSPDAIPNAAGAVTTPPVSTAGSDDQRVASLAVLGVKVHDLIKLPSDNDPRTQQDTTVYYVGADARRHAFPDMRVYASWYCDFSLVKTVPAENMANIPLGKNVVYRSGLRLVKFVSAPTVYLVQPSATLRAIGDEASAQALIGEGWAKTVSDVSDGNFSDYHIGDPLPSVTAAGASVYDISSTYPSGTMDIAGYADPANIGGTMHCAAMPPASSLTVASGALSQIPASFLFQELLSLNTFDSLQVRYLQMLLSALGKGIYPEQTVNGNFGPATQAAVRRFQAANGIEQKGFVGEMTRVALNKILAASR
jgi:hypothetical protein